MDRIVARIAVVDREAVRDLQWQVLRSGVPQSAQVAFEPDPADAFSVGAFTTTGEAIGAATFMPQTSPVVDLPEQWRLRGMATASGAQGQGVGSRVLAVGLAEVARRGGQSLWCNARSSALGFYRREGFHTIGEEFIVAELGLPHYVAARLIPTDLVTDPAADPPA